MSRYRPGRFAFPKLAAAVLLLLGTGAAPAAELLEGEFGDIDLGRRLIEPARFPTIRELRQAVGEPDLRTVLMLKLSDGGGGRESYHLPIFSGDGRRLALQRGDVRTESSKLLLYQSLDQAEPTLLTDQPGVSDFMFRWGVNHPESFAFARIHVGQGATHVYVSTDGRQWVSQTSGPGRHVFPALYARTDGIWRLVYERDGQVMHRAWNDAGPIEKPRKLVAGSTPRWSRDGSRLLMALQRPGRSEVATYDMVVRDLRTEKDRVLPTGEVGIVRGPSWSPDQRLAAFYVRQSGREKPWRIRICPVEEDAPGRTVGGNVKVNLDYNWEGPAWEPGGRRVWFFSNEHQHGAYHPLVAADARTGQIVLVDYPRRCTTPDDLAINPVTAVPEMAFVAHEGLLQELFIVFLNHY